MNDYKNYHNMNRGAEQNKNSNAPENKPEAKKPLKKIYQAKGLLEYQMTINAGGVTLRICFSGGMMGSNGVQGGTYITDNPVLQRLIEASPQFLQKRIVVRPWKEPEKDNKRRER